VVPINVPADQAMPDIDPTQLANDIVTKLAVLSDTDREWVIDFIKDHFCTDCYKFNEDCKCEIYHY
jgi:hypothetical protein